MTHTSECGNLRSDVLAILPGEIFELFLCWKSCIAFDLLNLIR